MHPLSPCLPNGLPAHIELTVKACDQRQKIFSVATEPTQRSKVRFVGQQHILKKNIAAHVLLQEYLNQWAAPVEQSTFSLASHKSITSPSKSHLYDGDDGDEDRWRTQAVLVEVPASVRLAGQDLVGHIADKTFVQTQPRLVQQDLPLQRAAAISNGPSETAGALTAHLGRRWRNMQVSFPRVQCSSAAKKLRGTMNTVFQYD